MYDNIQMTTTQPSVITMIIPPIKLFQSSLLTLVIITLFRPLLLLFLPSDSLLRPAPFSHPLS